MKTLTKAEIRALWKEFRQNRDDRSRNLLILHYLPTVKYTAERMHARFPSSIELDDMQSVGLLGMMDAIEKFDPQRGVLFETYCTLRIKGTIIDDLRKKDWVPRLVRQRAQQIETTMLKLETLFGRLPSDEEMAGEMEVDMDEFYRIQRDANAISLISLDNDYAGTDGEESLREIDRRANPKSMDPFYEILKKDLREFITKGFSREEQMVITLYYYEEMTMNEIGRTLGISESRISQIHSSVIARFRCQINKTRLLRH
ncbi:MAG: FliA/WhiG family RNA polymerase sigma factor [Planctomycetota bacterium]|jgi:RNA polymerase sigma factor for flagellar operon FliA